MPEVETSCLNVRVKCEERHPRTLVPSKLGGAGTTFTNSPPTFLLMSFSFFTHKGSRITFLELLSEQIKKIKIQDTFLEYITPPRMPNVHA